MQQPFNKGIHPMQQEKKSLTQSFGKMSLEGQGSKNSSSFSKNTNKRSMVPQMIDSGKIIKGQKKSLGLFNKLLGSDPNRPNDIFEEASDENQHFQRHPNSLKMFGSDKGDHSKMQHIAQNFRMQPEDFIQAPLNHKCDCVYFKQPRYCPLYCECYDKAEMCSKEKCCPQCYNTKMQRLPTLQRNQGQLNISPDKIHNDFIEIWGNRKPNEDPKRQKPQSSKLHHCKCRKTACIKNYCICRNNNEQCDQQCGCELPCKNRVVPLYPAPKPQPSGPYLSDNQSFNSSNKSMKFDRFKYP